MKNFFRKVAFGLKPEEKAPSDPLTWAQKQDVSFCKPADADKSASCESFKYRKGSPAPF